MASIQGIYLALFGRPADPAGLAYWTEQSKNGADLSKVIDIMTKLPEATARFGGLTDAALVTVVYQALFDRVPDAAGLAFFTEQLKSGKQSIGSIAINILDGAGGTDLTLIQNREKAANVFTASIDTPAEIAAYNGAAAAEFARSFIKTVSIDANSIPSATQVQASINTGLPSATGGQTPAGGQTPTTGGGGGDTTPAPAVAALNSSKALVLAANADATVTLSGGSLVISANGFSSAVVTAADVEKITLSSGAKLHTLGTAPLNGATNLKEISGAGTLDVQGVIFKNANGSEPDAKARFEPTPSLDAVYSKVATGTGFTVNGNEADTIKGIWDVLDDRYGDAGYTNAQINGDFINLGLRYVDFLSKGGVPFTDLVAKADASGRSQSMHDNLLGNLNKVSVESRLFTDTEKNAFLARIPDEYENRPVYDGNKTSVGGATHDGARAFDYAKGWARPDYLDKQMSGKIDASAIKSEKELFVGSGNTVDGFNIVRHEGAGIELALKAKVRGGVDYKPSDANNDGITEYNVEAGTSATDRAKWSFDFSVATGLNTQNASKNLNDYKFKAFVDVDPTDKVNYLVFEMQNDPTKPATTPWVLVKSDGTLDTTAGFADEEKSPGDINAKISQNSVNFGFGFIRNKIDGDLSTPAVIDTYNFTKGKFDIEFKAFDATGVKELASNHIQVVVDGGLS